MTAAAQQSLFSSSPRTATFCPRRIYRYELWRQLRDGDRYVNFICLNPSTADENTDDATVRKCSKFTWNWGYDALCITNLFAYRSTDPYRMIKAEDPVGYGNDRHLVQVAEKGSLIVCAWGRHGSHLNRATQVLRLLDAFDLHYLRITNVEPWHPLYLPDDTRPASLRDHYSRLGQPTNADFLGAQK